MTNIKWKWKERGIDKRRKETELQLQTERHCRDAGRKKEKGTHRGRKKEKGTQRGRKKENGTEQIEKD